MLAEIFILKLEVILRQAVDKRAMSSRARFVPIKLPVSFKPAPGQHRSRQH